MITIAFVFWGIGPNDATNVAVVAEIEGETIKLDEFWRSYDNEYKRLRDQNKKPEEIDEKQLKDRVLASLVDRTVLLIAADKADITVTEKDLQQAIISMPYFQKDGVFNEAVYKRALNLNRITPQIFEKSVKQDMTINRMTRMVGETASLSPEEQKIIDSMTGGNKDQLTGIFLSNKSNQAVQAYIESIKRQLKISIKRDIIS